MNVLPVFFIYTQDADLERKVSGYLKLLAIVRPLDSPARVETVLQQFDPTLVFLDVRGEDSCGLMHRIAHNLPQSLIVVMGCAGSDPVREALQLGVYAVEDLEPERTRLQGLVVRAQSHLRLLKENAMLKADQNSSTDHIVKEAGVQYSPKLSPVSFYHFSRAFRHFDKLETMLENLVEGVVSLAKVTRAGVFSITGNSSRYRLRAGIKCMDSVRELEMREDDPLVRWLQINAHAVSRSSLGRIRNAGENMMLKSVLDNLGAEILVPLFGRDRVNGWLFVGHHITGAPFQEADIEELILLSEHISIALENALLYEKVTVNRSLVDTVFNSIPSGIVAVSADGVVQLVNSAAKTILELPERAGETGGDLRINTRVMSLLNNCIRGDKVEPVNWTDTLTKRALSAVAFRLGGDRKCMGAVAIINDLTHELRLREEQETVERATFWAELASAMSHEIRNPLVAISAFAQMLPEKYEDEKFRTDFCDLVFKEIGRLNAMVSQITAFGHPAELVFKRTSIGEVLKRACEQVAKAMPASAVRVDLNVGLNLPEVLGDQTTLIECFAQLIINAVEASERASADVVKVRAYVPKDGLKTHAYLLVQVKDKAAGITEDVKKRVFSPFYTTKVRGIGLGLPIARRTIKDHSGLLDIETAATGTTVNVMFPAANVVLSGIRKGAGREAHSCR